MNAFVPCHSSTPKSASKPSVIVYHGISHPIRALTRSMSARGAHREPLEVVRPSIAVVVDRLVWQARVHEANAGLVAFGMQRDLEGGRSGWDRVPVLFPPEGEDHLLHGNDLDVLARRLELT